MGRAIVVLCLPRSGSSAVAGALHRMGVNMGEGHLQKPDHLNERGYYEDLRWQRISKLLAGFGYSITHPYRMGTSTARMLTQVLNAVEDLPVWGFKSPRGAFTFPLFLPEIEARGHDVRIVYAHRDYDAVIASMKRHSEIAWGGTRRMTQRGTEVLLANWKIALNITLRACEHLPVCRVNYEDVLAKPKATLGVLEAFAFDGIENLSQGIDEAVAWIDPSLRHCR